MDILNPGDIRSGSFIVTNMGNKSADIRTTIALTAYDRNGDPIDLEGSNTTQSMYDLYLAKDVEYVDGRGNMPKQGAMPLQTKNVHGNVITYSIPEYSLNGNSDLYDEVETIKDIINHITPFGMGNLIPDFWVEAEKEEIIPAAGGTFTTDYQYNCDFVLVFNTQAGNKWQGSTIQIDVIVEAKQHENTQAGWDIVAQQDLTVGSLNQSVVLPENVITNNGIINPGYEYTPSNPESGSTTDTCVVKGQFRIYDSRVYDKIGDDLNTYLYNIETDEISETIYPELIWDEALGAYIADFEFADVMPDAEYELIVVGDGKEEYYRISPLNPGDTVILTIALTYRI